MRNKRVKYLTLKLHFDTLNGHKECAYILIVEVVVINRKQLKFFNPLFTLLDK